jgi:hypothetical protein
MFERLAAVAAESGHYYQAGIAPAKLQQPKIDAPGSTRTAPCRTGTADVQLQQIGSNLQGRDPSLF